MSQNQSETSITQVIDTLLDDLSKMADDSKTSAIDFFGRIVSTIETLFSPIYIAVLAKGPSQSNLFVSGSTSIRGVAISEMSATSYFSKFLAEGGKTATSVFRSSEFKNVASSIRVDDLTWGGLVIRFSESTNVEALLPVFNAIREVSCQFLANQIRSKNAALFQNLQSFSLNAHSSLNPRLTANLLSNDARLILNCERLSVFQVTRNRPQLLAVSSVSAIENRTGLAKRMNQLVKTAFRLGKPVFSDQPPSSGPLLSALNAHREVSGFPFVLGIPLVKQAANKKRETTIGYLLAESDDKINRFEFSRALQLVAPHMGLALDNARKHSRIPFRRTLSALGAINKTPAVLLGAMVLLFAAFCLCFLKTDFKVRMNGELRPVVERTVFAPAQGFVDRVLVNHGDSIEKDQVLIELSSPKLQLELEQIQGDILKYEKLRETKKIALNQAASGNVGDQQTLGRLASEISELDVELGALRDKLKFVNERIADLVILSPIEGRVTTWQLKQSLSQKPVVWGEGLVDIAFEKGEWDLTFKVPEYRIGYLLQARSEAEEPLKVEFFFESKPDEKFTTSVSSISESTEMDLEFGPIVKVICRLPETEFVNRHGAKVIANVTCGKKVLLFAWTQELVDSARRRLVW